MIITDGYYEGETILLDEVSCTYLQEPDCTESRDDDPQSIKLTSRDGGGGKFIYIETKGWSIDDNFKSLIEVLEDFKHRMNDTFRNKSKDIS